MTKNDLAVKLCYCLGLSKSDALHAVEGVADAIGDAFVRGENVYLRGFGTLEVVQRKERPARNISAGTQIMMPAYRTVKFKISKELKNRMNNGTMD